MYKGNHTRTPLTSPGALWLVKTEISRVARTGRANCAGTSKSDTTAMIVPYLPYPVGPRLRASWTPTKNDKASAEHAYAGAADRCADQLASKALPIGEVEWKPYHSRRSSRRTQLGTLAHAAAVRLHTFATYHLIASFNPSPMRCVGS